MNRRDADAAGLDLAYWVGNPVLNPAVLAFLALVAPWQWVATRVSMGIVLVFGVSVLVARFGDRDARRPDAAPEPPPGYSLASSPRRFAQALARVSVTLLPEYAIVVFLLGLFRGWAFPLDGSAAHWSVLAVGVAAVLGTLVVVPTGGEIPILLGLALAGVSAGVLGALLIALPAVSIVSMAMVVRDLSPRTTLATAGGVMVTALAAGGLLALLT